MAKKIVSDDPLLHLPIGYQDRRTPTPVKNYLSGFKILAAGIPVRTWIEYIGNRETIGVQMKDWQGNAFYIRYYMVNEYLLLSFRPSGRLIYIWGSPKSIDGKWWFSQPDFPDEIGKIYPVYHLEKGIGQLRFWKHISGCLDGFEDELSTEELNRYGLPTLENALKNIHIPKSMPTVEDFRRVAFRRIADTFDEVVFPNELIDVNISKIYSACAQALFGKGKDAVREFVSDDLGVFCEERIQRLSRAA